MKEILIHLDVVNPFSIQFQTMGMMVMKKQKMNVSFYYLIISFLRCFFLFCYQSIQLEPLGSLRAQEPFILMIDTKCTCIYNNTE